MYSLRNQSGFILAATIILLAVITIAASIFALWVERKIGDAAASQMETQLARDRFSTFNTLLYILSTGQMENRGVRFPAADDTAAIGKKFLLRLNNRPYKGYGDIIFTIQDEAGLLGINTPDPVKWDTFLGQFNIPRERRSALLAKLLDYIDPNDSFHLNGAERPHYKRRGRTGPPNRQLYTSWELKNVLDWDQPELWKDNRLPRLTTTHFSGPISLQSASREILQTLPELTRQEVATIISLRQNYRIATLRQLEKILDRKLPALDMAILFTPSLQQRITFYSDKNNRAEEFHIKLTPFGPHGVPWRIDSNFSFSLQQQDDMLTAHEDIPFFQETMGTHQ